MEGYSLLMRYLFLILPLFCQAQLKIELGNKDIASIYYGRELLRTGQQFETAVMDTGSLWQTASFQRREGNRYYYRLQWGVCSFAYTQEADTLHIDYTLENKGGVGLKGVSISALNFDFKEQPEAFKSGYPYIQNNLYYPSFVSANVSFGKISVEQPDASRYINTGWINSTTNGISRVWIGSAPYSGMQNFDYRSYINVKPGDSAKFRITIRFTPPSSDTIAGAKVFGNWRSKNPYLVSWPDRRPIAAVFLASYKPFTWQNPRNWTFVDQSKDVVISYGSDYRTRALNFADQCIKEMNYVGSQGVIIWDIEGQQNAHPISYIGAPEMLPVVSPEMDAVADEFFKRFRMEGYKVGITVRCDSVYMSKDGARRVGVKDPARMVIKRIKYAQARWGCSIFYFDSNVDTLARALPVQVLIDIQKACPDVLLIPEHSPDPGTYRVSAPYLIFKNGQYQIPQRATDMYPQSFGVMMTADGPMDGEKLQQAKEQGIIPIYRGWYRDPMNELIRKIWY